MFSSVLQLGDAQLPAQQLRQQRVAQGGEGAGLVFEGADLFIERTGLALVGDDDFRWWNHEGEFLKAVFVDGPEDGSFGLKAGEFGIQVRHRVVGERSRAGLVAHRGDAAPDAALLVRHVDVADGSTDADERVTGLGVASRRGAIDSSCRETEAEVGSPLVERKAVAVFVVGVARRRLSHREIEAFDDCSRFPSFRNVAEW